MSAPKSEAKPVHLVLQRYRSCRILLDETEWVEIGGEKHSGLLVYVSFAESATPSSAQQAAVTVMNLKIATMGQWGDGQTDKLLKMESPSIVLVPQANLISKVKSQGKSIQYHGQVAKEKGEELYLHFLDCIKGLILEDFCEKTDKELPGWYTKWKQRQSAPPATDPSIPPDQLFRTEEYASWDEDGIPLTKTDGEELTKSAMKKCRKAMDAQAKRHEKWKAAGAVMMESTSDEQLLWDDVMEPSYCPVIAGSFGKRQGLEIKSDMGPFCHVLQV